MRKEKLSKVELEEIFQEGRFIARALETDALSSNGKAKFNQAEDEIKYLNTKRSKEGEHENVERNGQRGRSATLLVPGVDMTLFDKVGFLYDADKSTIKGYMFRDSYTLSQALYDNYHNINIDKKKFEPIISRIEFMEKYRDYRSKIENPELQAGDNTRNWEDEENHEYEPYNEVLGNFFPESLIGLVGKDSTLETKRNLLLLKNVLSKHGEDLPMVLMNEGKINDWNPDLKEIAEIINLSKIKIKRELKNIPRGDPNVLLKNFANNLGYALDNISFNEPITPEHLKINNQFEFQANEIIDYLSKITNIPKGSTFSYGIEGRLLEVINKRLESEGEQRVTDLKETILNEKDVKNLVALLDKEICTKNATHKLMTNNELNVFSESIVSNINSKRAGAEEDLTKIQPLNNSISSSIGRKISEFFTKVASLFKENVVTNKIEKFKHYKDQITQEKKPASDNQEEQHIAPF